MKKILPFVLGLIAILLFIAGTAAGSNMNSPAVETTEEGELVMISQPDTLLKEVQSIISQELDEAVGDIVAQVQNDPTLEAKIKITGEVFYCDCETTDICQFILFDEKKETLVEGDAIRTGKDGTASISFGNQADMILARNTQIRILEYQTLADGTIQIHIEQIIGEAYFNVKYSRKESQQIDYKLLTPTALIEQEKEEGKYAFSGISLVQYKVFSGLTPEDLAEAIDNTFTSDCGALCIADSCSNCLTFAGLAPIDLTLDDLTGNILVKYITEDGYRQSIIYPGQTLRFIFDGFEEEDTWQDLCQVLRAIRNGETPSVSNIETEIIDTFISIRPSSSCGDGICDNYAGENNNTCPQDCN